MAGMVLLSLGATAPMSAETVVADAADNNPRAAHLIALRARVPAGFTIVDESPFFVVGDESRAKVRERAATTVHWAVVRLQKEFFKRMPKEIIDIWLFRDARSYELNTQAIFHEKPTTPYGFYSPRHHALIMNISTGGGTLVHEIVHPFLRANFPNCPPWFDEGLASLYEQSAERDGHIVGLVNWRLAGLQKAIRNKTTLSFRNLTSLTRSEFYGDTESPDYNRYYGQSRYLCFYLQERGLLQRFYREFVAHADDDPSGYATLQRVLGEKDMEDFHRKWDKFVLKLTPP